MLFSYKELKKLANLPKEITLDQVISAINSIGFEVESTKDFAKVEGIKFGKIIEIYQNPNSNNLKVCEIEFNDKKRTIQTNSNNVFEGMYVVAFVPGSKKDNIIFEEKNIKGINSEGMLSSISEFGISSEFLREKSKEGIQAYPEIDLNTDPIEYLGLNDTLIDIDILSNRTDARSYLIMAREISAFFQVENNKMKKNESNIVNKIKIEKSDLSKQFAILESKNNFDISLKEQIFLAKNNIKSINNAYDLGSLILLMTGQPTFVYAKTKEDINITFEKMTGLVKLKNNKEIDLKNNLITKINNVNSSISGIEELEYFPINNKINNLIIELSLWNNKEIRSAIKQTKINNHRSIQSSKKLNKGTTELAIQYLSNKLKDFSNIINFEKNKNKEIIFDKNYLNKTAGFKLTENVNYIKAINSLKILGFEFKEGKIIVPSYRYDIKTHQDLNEEIFRFFGYNNFPLIQPKISNNFFGQEDSLHEKIISQGYQEIVSYTLISKEKNIFNPFNLDKTIKLKTFVSQEREVIRNSQITSMIEVIEYNLKRNIKNINIFSQGMIQDSIQTISLASTKKTFFEMKQNLINILPENIIFKKTEDKNLHPNLSADIYLNNEKIGFLGQINPKIYNKEFYISEILIDKIKSSNKQIYFKDYDRNPLKQRDITFELNEKENIGKYLESIECVYYEVVDSFKNKNKNKITVRFSLTKEQSIKIDKNFNNK